MASKVSSKTTTNQVGEEEARLELPPVIRFQPSSFYCPVFADADLTKIEPWDVPGKEKMGEQEWYSFSHKDRKYPTGMRTNRATASGYWKATGKDKEIFRGHFVLVEKKKTDGVDVSTGDVRISAHDDDGFNLARVQERYSLPCSLGASKPSSVRFSTSDVLYDKMAWATIMERIKRIASSLVDLYSPWSQCHLDVKPLNILLDEKTENQLSDFGLPNLLHEDGVPANNRPLDAKVSGKPSAKRGIEINISSHMTHRQRHLRVHYHPLIQMLPTARKWSGDILTSCARLITSMRNLGTAEAGSWVSANPKYETPRAGPVSEYIIRKLFGIRNGLTENESQQHSDPNSCRSGHHKRAVNTKTSASWIVATSAPHHATGNRSLLSGFIMDHDDQFVHAVNRVPMKVLARGAVVTDAFILPDVWFVPGLTENLVSVSQLAELDHSVGFGRGECCIRSARDAKIVGKGRLQKGGHYVLDYLKVPLAI